MTRLDAPLGRTGRHGPAPMAPRFGFTLPEVITAMVIVAVIAAFVIPTVFGRGKAARVDALVAELTNLETGIMLYRGDVGRFPGRLQYLTMGTPVGTFVDVCGTNLTGTVQGKFRGPYLSRSMVLLTVPGFTSERYVLATGDSVDATVTFQAAFQGQRVIQIIVRGPELDIAKALDAKIDGVEGFGAGKLQYADTIIVPTGANLDMEKRVTYTIPIRAGNC